MTPAARRGMLIMAQQALIKSSASYDEGCDLLLKVLNDWTEAEVYKKPDFSEEKQALKQRLIDAVERLDKEMPSWIDRMPFDRFLEEIEKVFIEQ